MNVDMLALMNEPAAKREGRHNVLSVRKSSCVLKNAELKKAQAKHRLPLIMQVDEPVLTEDYVPRVPTVTKQLELVETQRFFSRGFLQLTNDDSL